MLQNLDHRLTSQPFKSLRRKKVLLVEDDSTLDAVFTTIFENIDPLVDMDWVTSGEEAVSLLNDAHGRPRRAPYDLIIADIFLDGKITGMDFWDLCKAVFPEMPVLLMSGLPLHKFFDLIGTTNISPPFLQKPLRLGECQQTLKGMLEYVS